LAAEFTPRHLVFAGLCLVAFSAPVGGAPAPAVEDEMSSSSLASSAAVVEDMRVQLEEGVSASPGGALYSPFSTTMDAATPLAQARPVGIHGPPQGSEDAPGLVTTTLAGALAAGLLGYLLRLLLVA
jgi:hypothetical protein